MVVMARSTSRRPSRVALGSARSRRPADESLADVHRGLPVDEPLSLEQRDAGGRPHRDDGFGWNGASAARATGLSTGPTTASSRGGDRWRSSAHSPQPNAPGARPSIGATSRSTETPSRSSSSSPQIRPSRRSTWASIELPDGIGLSSSPFVRATSSSPPVGARKKPPCSGSWKSSTASRASRCASRSQRASPVATWSSISPCATLA